MNYIFAEDAALVGIYVVREHPGGDSMHINGNWVTTDGYIQDTMYYVHQDRLGSYAVITDDTGQVKQRLGYDVWGNRVLDTNWTVRAEFDNGDFDYIFRRGFTGHEHLGSFGIINMNGRIYDPNIASFFSPDPFVVDATSTQAFNRYSYCLNNPLMYTDPSGEFILGTLLGLVSDVVTNIYNTLTTGNVYHSWFDKDDWRKTTNGWGIDMGLFRGTPDQIVSRFTNELPQTILGYTASTTYNALGGVKSVSHYDGATVVESYSSGWGAFTLGSYIIGQNGIVADPNNYLFQHEYGHYLQSQDMGWWYLPRVGIPSFISAAGDGDHKLHSVEQDANRRAFLYFNENVDGFYQTEAEYRYNQRYGIEKGWNFYQNPLDVGHTGARGIYYDYNNPEHRVLINGLSLKSNIKWIHQLLQKYQIIIWESGR